MKNKGFIKLYRSMLSKPEMTDLVNEQGAVGFGVYLMIVLYLSQCDDFEGAYTNGQLQSLADQARKSRAYIRHIIEDYGLFKIEGKRFHESFMNQYSHARNNRYAREDVEIDIEKEKKEKCVRRKGTHSEFETLRAGRRYASHGQPLPADAPPQRRRNDMYSYIRHDWVPAEEFEKSAEMIVFHQLFNDDTV
ncbi:MAG: DUF4373 domain-containing protein [Prevotella ruminicola]|uniref:DUF4373 domain-containing protein n=1 Tax=Xylanibacter ruminicola TaxID=839 RepID=A0A9D5P3E8_XYLRU|nr:DUF4373 domain-containing protein [Xylanibacter ruminicola]